MGVAAFLGVMTGGLITDRIGGRKVSMIADLLSTVTALLLGIALFFDYFSLWLVIVSQIIGVFFDGPGQIAKNTLVPAAATEQDVPIVRAMGLQQTLQNVANFIGPLSAGLLVALLSESVTLMFASVLFAVCVFLVIGLPRKNMVHERQLSVRQAYEDMREAVRFVFKDPLLGPMQLFGPLFAFIVGPVSSIVFPAWFVFARQSAVQLGTFLGAQALGGMIGGFLFAAFAPKNGCLVPQVPMLWHCLACISYNPDRSLHSWLVSWRVSSLRGSWLSPIPLFTSVPLRDYWAV
jgi:MFS family permease